MENLFAFFAGIAFFSRAKQSLPPREGRRVLRALASNAPVGWKVHSCPILTSLALVRFSYTFTRKYLYYFIIILYYLYYFSIKF